MVTPTLPLSDSQALPLPPRYAARARKARSAWWRTYTSWPMFLWFLLWAGINTGPEVFYMPAWGIMDWLHGTRALLPIFAFLAAAAGLSTTRHAPLPFSLYLWTAYGLLAFLGATQSPVPQDAMAYWSIAYFSAFATLKYCMRSKDPLNSLVELNYFTWAIAATVITVLAIVARDTLFVQTAAGITGYGLINRMGTVAGMAMSRETGMARLAAVPAIAALVLVWRDRHVLRKFLWLAIWLAGSFLIYIMQSRGALLGYAAAVMLVVFMLGVRFRIVAVITVAILLLLFAADIIPSNFTSQAFNHLTRGQSVEELTEMTGRVQFWSEALQTIESRPLMGWGFQADRNLFEGSHIHNTYMYAALAAGLPGVALFTAGLIVAWFTCLRVYFLRLAEKQGQQTVFLQVAGILAFFTVRGIPEVSGASFSIDTLVMLPAIAYLGTLNSSSRSRREFFRSPLPLPVAPRA